MASGQSILGSHLLDLLLPSANSNVGGEIASIGNEGSNSFMRFYDLDRPSSNGYLVGLSNQNFMMMKQIGTTQIGIGTSRVRNATANLEVAGNISTSNITTYNSDSNVYFGGKNIAGIQDINFAGTLLQGGSPFKTSQWTTNGSNIYISGSNVGIGTVSPSNALHVIGDAYFSGTVYAFDVVDATGTTSTFKSATIYQGTNNTKTLFTNATTASDRILFSINLLPGRYLINASVPFYNLSDAAPIDSVNWAQLGIYKASPATFTNTTDPIYVSPISSVGASSTDLESVPFNMTLIVNDVNGADFVVAVSGKGHRLQFGNTANVPELKLYAVPLRGLGVEDPISTRQAIQINAVRQSYTATAGQTTFALPSVTGYFTADNSNADVYVDGSKLRHTEQYAVAAAFNSLSNLTVFTVATTTGVTNGAKVDIAVWPYAIATDYYKSGYLYQNITNISTPWLNVAGGGVRTPERVIVDGDLYVQGNIYGGCNTTQFAAGVQWDSITAISCNVIGTLNLINGAVTPAKTDFSTGNIGIGTTSAQAPLHVVGTTLVQGDILPTACNVYNLGSADYRFKDLFLSGSSINLDGMVISKDATTGGLKVTDTNNTPLSTSSATITATTSVSTPTLTTTGANINVSAKTLSNVTALSTTAITTTAQNINVSAKTLSNVNALSTANITSDAANINVSGKSLSNIATINATGNVTFGANATVSGTLSASNLNIIGDFVTLNTMTSNTEQMVVNNAGTGPALKVIQSGNNSVAEFYDAEVANPALFISNNGTVGIGTSSPQDIFHVYQTAARGGCVNSGDSMELGSGRNADGVAYLDLVGDATYNDWGARFIRNGGSNGITFIAHRGTGNLTISTQEAANIAFETNSIARATITSAGSVGIGTTTPVGKLHVEGGSIQIQSTSPTIAFYETDGATDQKYAFISQNGGSMIHYFANDANNTSGQYMAIDRSNHQACNIRFMTGASVERMRIDNAGNVAIGTPTANYKLHVQGSAYINRSLYLTNGSTNNTPALSIGPNDYFDNGNSYGLVNVTAPPDDMNRAHIALIRGGNYVWQMGYTSNTNTLGFWGGNYSAGNAALMSLKTDGNLGIGNTNPIYKLHVQGATLSGNQTAGTTVDLLRLHAVENNLSYLNFFDRVHTTGTADWTRTSTRIQKVVDTSSHGYIEFNPASGGAAQIAISGDGTTENIRFAGSGNVGIGTTNPTARLHIEGGGLRIRSGITNATTRPAISTSIASYEIRSSGSVDTADDGFLRLSAGGGTNTTSQSAIDISGYSQCNEMDRTIRLVTAGVERVRINASGYVGVGTTAPASRLHLADSTLYIGKTTTSGATNEKNWFESYGGTQAVHYCANDANNASSVFYVVNRSGYLPTFQYWATNGAERMRLNIDGNIGIGTNAPLHKHDVRGTATSIDDYTFYKSYAVFQHRSDAGYEFLIARSNQDSETLYTDRANIQYLVVSGFDNNSIYKVLDISIHGNPNYFQIVLRSVSADVKYETGVFNTNYTLHTYSARRAATMTVTGNVGIGTASPLAKLHVVKGGTTKGVTAVYTSGSFNSNSITIALDTTNFKVHKIYARYVCNVKSKLRLQYGTNSSTFQTTGYENTLFRTYRYGSGGTLWELQDGGSAYPTIFDTSEGTVDNSLVAVVYNYVGARTQAAIDYTGTWIGIGATRVTGCTQWGDNSTGAVMITHIKLLLENYDANNVTSTATISGEYYVEGVSATA